MIGPLRGGRVTTVTGVPSEPYTFYMGSTGGGVWKTTDAGHSWSNISDGFFSVASMGAIDVSLSDPNIIFAGTGSSKIRSNVSIGRGIYKSTDAGKTWQLLRPPRRGPNLDHPHSSHQSSNRLRGRARQSLHRQSRPRRLSHHRRRKILEEASLPSDVIGAADLELQPGNPNVIFACMWFGERKPWTILSGAKEGGIYKITDGGDTWNKLSRRPSPRTLRPSQRRHLQLQTESHLRADRSQTRLRPLSIGRLGRDLER